MIMEKREPTAEELREMRIVELAYELQLDDDDDDGGSAFGGELKAEYYEMARKELEEEGNE